MAVNLTGPYQAVVGDSESRHSTQKNPLGAVAFDKNGGEYRYIQASGVIAAGAPVDVTNGLSDVISSPDALGFAGVAQAAFADDEFGFVLVRGGGLGLVPSGVALGDTVTAGNGALSATLTAAVRFATVTEAPVLLSGTTQLKGIFLH